MMFLSKHDLSDCPTLSASIVSPTHTLSHWACIISSGILGIPPTNGLIPQAPLHTRSLTVTKSEQVVSNITGESRRVDVVVKVHEQRVSNMGQAVLIGMMCFNPFLDVLSLVPTAALNGTM